MDCWEFAFGAKAVERDDGRNGGRGKQGGLIDFINGSWPVFEDKFVFGHAIGDFFDVPIREENLLGEAEQVGRSAHVLV